jgi:hypothetical protein
MWGLERSLMHRLILHNVISILKRKSGSSIWIRSFYLQAMLKPSGEYSEVNYGVQWLRKEILNIYFK